MAEEKGAGPAAGDVRKARLVFAATRADIESGRWTKLMWSDREGRGCLHTLLARNVQAITGTGYPTPVDGLVFYAMWGALEAMGMDMLISQYNDMFGTGPKDVLALLDAAKARLDG